jgi:hypothetical protein
MPRINSLDRYKHQIMAELHAYSYMKLLHLRWQTIRKISVELNR